MKAMLHGISLLLMSSSVLAQSASRITPQLQARIERATDEEKIPIIVMMADQFDLKARKEVLGNWSPSKAERHQWASATLQAEANKSQPALLAVLNLASRVGQAKHLQPFWIINGIALEGTRHLILQLAARTDVGMIYGDDQLELEEPVNLANAPVSTRTAEPGLRIINAHRLWEIGYTGKGALVMNIDTGVDGDHPALSARWRGNQAGVKWYHAWLDFNIPPSNTPVDYGEDWPHGTATMGVAVGRDPLTLDTIGVALDAEWIAATGGAILMRSAIIAAFQWAADPDSNTATSVDVPDVISNSITFPGDDSYQCDNNAPLFVAIRNVEALGTAVVWAAGNGGPNQRSIISPANNRSIFCVGNLDATVIPLIINPTSSRGPSSCDGGTPKPELVAPGTLIRVSWVSNGYKFGTGTSYAAPHVAGAIALIRSARPSLDGQSIINAIVQTATDLGDLGPDDNYGWGLIDVWAAFRFLTIDDPQITGIVTEAGTSTGLGSVQVHNLTENITASTHEDGSFLFVPAGRGLYRFRFSRFGYYTRTESLQVSENGVTYNLNVALQRLPSPHISVEPTRVFIGIIPIGRDTIASFSITNDGPAPSLLTYSLTIDTTSGAFFQIESLLNDTLGGSMTTNHVLRFNASGIESGYFANTIIISSNDPANERILFPVRLIISSGVTLRPVDQRWNLFSLPRTLPNNCVTEVFPEVTSLVFSYTGNRYVSEESLKTGTGFWARFVAKDTIYFYGTELDKDTIHVEEGWNLIGSISIPVPVASITSDPPGLVTSEFFGYNNSYYTTDTIRPGGGYWVSVRQPGILTLTATPLRKSASHIVILDFGELPPLPPLDNTKQQVPAEVPYQYTLEQNYPNPFNPTTMINFELTSDAIVTVKVFNTLGQEVATLAEREEFSAGQNELEFDGSGLSSGVYYYRITAEDIDSRGILYSNVKKMLLVK